MQICKPGFIIFCCKCKDKEFPKLFLNAESIKAEEIITYSIGAISFKKFIETIRIINQKVFCSNHQNVEALGNCLKCQSPLCTNCEIAHEQNNPSHSINNKPSLMQLNSFCEYSKLKSASLLRFRSFTNL